MEPRFEEEYSSREVEAARRAIIDVMQVLASFSDCLVLVGGWVPDLLILDAEVPHVGSIDVDLALETEKLMDGRYADMLELLLATRRYKQGTRGFQLVTTIDLEDRQRPIEVDIDFMGAADADTEKNNPKRLDQFRLLQADGCAAAFYAPMNEMLSGQMANGAENSVSIRIASIPAFLIMKAFALNGRDKPKDAYDICYCLDNYANGIPELAAAWRQRLQDGVKEVKLATGYLNEKFESVDAYGAQQVVEFHNSNNPDERAQQARRAYELVRPFLGNVQA
ncbi:MAG: nucleotidyl transferase AbiEii/AbiGii toxin family protein [Opitutaceae bacterium]